MIKKYLFLSTAFLAASSFSGDFYAGAGVAYINSASTITLKGTEDPFSGSTTISNTTTSVAPRFFAGYQKTCNNYFIGGEIVAAFRDISGKKSIGNLLGSNGVASQSIAADILVEYSRKHTIGGRLKLGAHITEEVSAFAGIGIISSRFKWSYKDENSPNLQSVEKTLFGIEPSVGMTYKLSSKWRFGLEYLHQHYGSFQTKNLNTDPAYSSILKSRFKFNTIFASISCII